MKFINMDQTLFLILDIDNHQYEKLYFQVREDFRYFFLRTHRPLSMNQKNFSKE